MIWTQVSTNPIINETGKYEGSLCMVADITERKKTDELLQRSEKRYREIVDEMQLESARLIEAQAVAKVGSWETDLQTFKVKWSKQTHDIFGTDPQNFQVTHDAFLQFIHPDDVNKVTTAFENSLTIEKIYFIQHRIITTNGEVKHVIENWKTINDMQGRPARAVGTCQDITQRKIAEQEKSSLEATLQSSLNEIYICNFDTFKFSYVNKGALLNLGYSEQEIKELTPIDIKPEFTFSAYERLVAPLVNNEKEKITFFTNHKRKDGSLYPVEVHLQLVTDGNSKRFLAIVLDITERKNAEEAIHKLNKKLTKSEKKFRGLIENSSDLVMLIDKDFTPIYLSPSTERVFGWTENDLKAKASGQHIHPEDVEKWNNVIKEISANPGKPFPIDLRSKHRQGHYVWLEGSMTNMLHDEFIKGIVCNFHDVTVRKLAEGKFNATSEELRKTSERLLLATKSAKIGVWDWDIENDFMKWDNRMYELYGIGPEHFTGAYSVWQNGVHPDDIERAAKELNDAIKGVYDFDTEFRVVWPDRSVRFIEAHAAVSKNETGVAIRMIGTNIDITERKKAEQKILKLNEEVVKSERFFKGLIESSEDMITMIGRDGKTTYASPSVSNKFGYTSEECLDFVITDIIHPDDVLIMQEFLMKIMINPGVPMECSVIRDRKKDGTYIWVEGTLTNFFETEGINAIVANFRDVTEKKKLEDLLEKSNRLAAIGSWEIDLIKGTVFWSAITKEILETDADFVPDLATVMQLFKEGSDRNIISNKLKDCIEKGIPWDDEVLIVTPIGNVKWMHTIVKGEFINEKCIKVYGSFQNIDTRKKAEIAVLKVYEEKNIILESIGDAFFAVDKNWVVTYWNNQAEKMLNTPKNKILNQHLWKVFADSIDSVSYIKYHEAIETNQIIRFEDYYASLDNWYDITVYPSNNGLSVFIKDITQQKKSAYEREKITADLIQRNNDLEQFSYIVSHNMRSPVANIIGLCDVLQSEKITDIFKSEILTALSSSVNRLDDVFRDLNNILKVRREVNDSKEVVCFSKIIKNVTLSIQSIIDKDKAVILSDFSEVNEMLTIKSYLHSIFYNLITNSLKYKQHGISPVINIRSQQLKNKIILFFNDNGIGIDLKKRGDQVFGLYKRFHTDMAEGKGMGLYMVKTQVESIRGNISITSEVNVGTEFKIEFET